MSKPLPQAIKGIKTAVQLQRQLANAVVLFMNYRRYHWLTCDPTRRELHNLFDEYSKQIRSTAEAIDERIRKLGSEPISSYQQIKCIATVCAARRQQDVRSMLLEANQHARKVILELHGVSKQALGFSDMETLSLLSSITGIHEKQERKLREILNSPAAGIIFFN